MKSKIVLIVLVLVSIASLGISYPKWPEVPAPAGSSWVWDDTTKAWRPASGSASGSSEVAPRPISDVTEVPLTVATNTVTYLQTNASWTAGDWIWFHARAKIYWGLVDAGATTTAAILKARGTPLESGTPPQSMLITPDLDLVFVADTAAASVPVTIGGQ